MFCVVLAVQVPVALATAQPERRVKPAVEKLNMSNYFDAIVTAEDNGAPEVSQHTTWLGASDSSCILTVVFVVRLAVVVQQPTLCDRTLTDHASAATADVAVCLQVEFSYIAAANQLQRPFVRCIVVGDSNRSVEAAHELGMKSVIVTGNQPAWNFSGADLVVRNLSQLSFVNMKKLFGNEDLVEAQFELEQQEQPDFL